MRILAGTGFLSTAALLLQVALTRVFSIAQFYHFAFLVISLALLGFGASGTVLALWPRLRKRDADPWYALGFALSLTVAYVFVNNQPFDSYSIAWDQNQLYLLIANLLALAVPFAFAGALIGSLLSRETTKAGRIYGANLLGSAMGAVSAPILITWLGNERVILLCAALGAIAALVFARARSWVMGLGIVGLVSSVALLLVFPSQFEIQPSPYKNLSRFRLNPDAAITITRQNAYARLDIVESTTIHSAQGLSPTYFGSLPPQFGLLIDGDNMLIVADTSRAPEQLAFSFPAAVAYASRPVENALILGSGGNMDAWAALTNGAGRVTVVEPNQLVYDALTSDLRDWAGLADDPRVTLVHEEIRAFIQRADTYYDVVQLALTDNYRPISSGAFTLTENYTLTVEAFENYLALAGQDGILVLTRWLQTPPSESLRTLALIVEALGTDDVLQHLVVFRSFQTATFIVKPTPFTPQEVSILLEAIERLRYDLVLAPQMPPNMINQYAQLETPVYHDLFLELATTADRGAFYDGYDFEISPPTDDRPFFFHFFRWEQTPDVIENLGRRWQPFGGSGFFVLLALLAFALFATLILVILPIGLRQRFRQALRKAGARQSAHTLGYFIGIGLAFLLVEVALIQQFILILGQPTLALATVIGALLFFSGLGSPIANRFPWRYAMVTLAFTLAVYPWVIDLFTPWLLSLPLILRGVAVSLLLAPVGFLMGMPFARGIAALSNTTELVPWAWAANGSASVVSSVLAVTLALSLGFTWVLLIGSGLYLLAALLSGGGSSH